MAEVQTVMVQSQESFNYKLYICGEIGDPSDHSEIIQALHNATPMDNVEIYINSGGGNLVTAIQIMDAIKHCDALVTGHLVGEALSAGGIILLSCDSWRISDYATLMVHNFSGGVFGKGHEMYSSVDYIKRVYPEFFKSFYQDFLEEEEINHVLAGNDMWMETEEIMERLNNLVTIRRKRIEDEEKAAFEELNPPKKKSSKKK